MIVSILVSCIIMYLSILLFLYEYGQQVDSIEEVEYIVVLGAVVDGLALSTTLKRRLQAAYRLAEKYDVSVIVSGGYTGGKQCSEAKVMQGYLLALGVKEERILLEDKSTSTYENFLYTYKLLGSKAAKIALVTCDYHMYRSCKIASRLGFSVLRNPSCYTSIHSVKEYTRECLCLLKYCIIKK